MKKTTPKPNEKKFQEMLIYVAARSEADESVGAVKFNKLLFNADYIAYGLYGRAISGVEYQRLPNGPAPRRMIPVTEDLKKEGAIAKSKRTWMGTEQHRILALRDADLSEFSAAEIDILNNVIQGHWGVSGTRMSRQSHEFLGWKLAKEGETIPYQAVFLSDRLLTESESAYALELVADASAT